MPLKWLLFTVLHKIWTQGERGQSLLLTVSSPLHAFTCRDENKLLFQQYFECDTSKRAYFSHFVCKVIFQDATLFHDSPDGALI
jgi:hypothetical protein